MNTSGQVWGVRTPLLGNPKLQRRVCSPERGAFQYFDNIYLDPFSKTSVLQVTYVLYIQKQ